MWPKEGVPWTKFHMDHAYIQGIGLFLILVDSFSGWPEVKMKDRKAWYCKTNIENNICKKWIT